MREAEEEYWRAGQEDDQYTVQDPFGNWSLTLNIWDGDVTPGALLDLSGEFSLDPLVLPHPGNLADLDTLRMNLNQLTSVPPEIGNMTGLWRLNVSDNRLTSVPPEIGNLIGLRDLDLSGNRLTSVPADMTKLIGLAMLDVSDNRWPSLPSQIDELNKIIETHTLQDVDDNPFG